MGMKTALILVDIQNDYFPNGKMELEGSMEAGLKAQKLLAYFRREHLGIVHIQHISVRPGGTFFLPGTAGANINALVSPREGEAVFQKNYPNSFRNTPLLDFLKGDQVERLIIGGMMTHMCIDATTRAAFDHGFECWVARDACATRALTFLDRTIPAGEVHLSFLAALQAGYAKVPTVDEIIERLGSARSDSVRPTAEIRGEN
jgi:nicotinamidase-related amidase